MNTPTARTALLLATTLSGSLGYGQPALADDADGRLTAIEKQIQSLQAELRQVKHELAARDREAKAAQARATAAQAQMLAARQTVPGPAGHVPHDWQSKLH